LLVRNDESLLLGVVFLVEHFDDWPGSVESKSDDILVDFLCFCSGLLEEFLVTDLVKPGFRRIRVGVDKVALVHEVAAQLLLVTSGEFTCGTECLNTIAVTSLGRV